MALPPELASTIVKLTQDRLQLFQHGTKEERGFVLPWSSKLLELALPNLSGIESIMKTVNEVLEKLPSKFQPDAAANLSAVFQLVIDDSQHFSLTIQDQQCWVERQRHPDPDITLIMEGQTFIDIISGDMSGTSAYMSGHLRAEGNVMLATKLGGLFKR